MLTATFTQSHTKTQIWKFTYPEHRVKDKHGVFYTFWTSINPHFAAFQVTFVYRATNC